MRLRGENLDQIPTAVFVPLCNLTQPLAKAHGLIICEGFFDVLELYEHGRENVVAIMGSSMSCEQERLIVEAVGTDGRVVLMFDNDAAGHTCTDDALQRLSRSAYVKVEPFSNTTD